MDESKYRVVNRNVKTFGAWTELTEEMYDGVDFDIEQLETDRVIKEVRDGMIRRGYRRIAPIQTNIARFVPVGGCHDECPASDDDTKQHTCQPPRIIHFRVYAHGRGYYVGKKKAREQPENLELGRAAVGSLRIAYP